MSRVVKLASIFLALSLSGVAADEQGVSPTASKIFDLGGGWTITNSMLTGWGVSALLVLLVLWMVRTPKLYPTKGQAVMEALIESLRELFEPIVGKAAFP